jgi:Na+-transporting methylmalonyl-CoA/oxaloacetate decarboxylase gamma subunit
MTNLAWGLEITALGMGLVFALLGLLWGLLRLALHFDNPPAAKEAAPSPGAGAERAAGVNAVADTPGVAAAPLDPDLVAAIAAAVFKHHSVLRHEAAPAMRSYQPGSLFYASRWITTGRTRQNRSWSRHR